MARLLPILAVLALIAPTSAQRFNYVHRYSTTARLMNSRAAMRKVREAARRKAAKRAAQRKAARRRP